MLRDKCYNDATTSSASDGCNIMSNNNQNNNVSGLGNMTSLVDNITSLSKEECSGMFEFDTDIHASVPQHKSDNQTKSSLNMATDLGKKLDQSPNNPHSPDLMRDSGIGTHSNQGNNVC